MIFGSLPAGINPTQPDKSQPWHTLLFCPYPAADNKHPGFASPPDYLLLDNFWMPTIEPYAISTCMTTSGKINLNDQIAPSRGFIAVPAYARCSMIFGFQPFPLVKQISTRHPVQSRLRPASRLENASIEDATVSQIENRFATGSVDAYLCEGEICSVPIVPSGVSASGLDAFWNGAQAPGGLTGDNLRELPYAQIYSRLTTRSNSYTVHVRVQVLQKLANDPQQNIWNEDTDLVRGDWRGSYQIERYLDFAATAPTAGDRLDHYKFRIVSSQRFAP